MKEQPTYISTIGLNTRSIKTFEFFFKNHCKGRYVLRKSHDDASLTLLDVDTPGSADALKDLQRTNPENKCICLSISEENSYNTHHIKKPINSTALIKLLEQLANTEENNGTQNGADDEKTVPATLIARENIKPFNQRETALAGKHLEADGDTHFFGEHKDITLDNKKELVSAQYYPEKMLQGAITEAYITAKENNCAVQLSTLGISILIDPNSFKVYSTVPERIIRPTCLLETNKKAQLKQLDVDHLKNELEPFQSNQGIDVNGIDIDTFIWKISLWSSRGRIPSGTEISAPVYLSHWPNLTRLDNIPHAPRIAALLISAPDTLCHIAEKLEIPQRYVFGFYSASHALGLSANARRQVDSLFKPDDIPISHSRSVLRRIFRHITRKTEANEPDHKLSTAR